MIQSILYIVFYGILPLILAGGMIAVAWKPALVREEKRWFFQKYRVVILVLGILFFVGNAMSLIQTLKTIGF